MAARTDDGRPFRTLTLIDDYTHECLAIPVECKLNFGDVLYTLADLMVERGVPTSIRSANGAEMAARAVRNWLVASVPRLSTLNPAVPGRTAITNRSMANSRMNC